MIFKNKRYYLGIADIRTGAGLCLLLGKQMFLHRGMTVIADCLAKTTINCIKAEKRDDHSESSCGTDKFCSLQAQQGNDRQKRLPIPLAKLNCELLIRFQDPRNIV